MTEEARTQGDSSHNNLDRASRIHGGTYGQSLAIRESGHSGNETRTSEFAKRSGNQK